ncbi:hypothetical protein CSKR_107955 [Clonorchis sinensis]|uniref:Uncharacterized protein n=1 Tax=Clonorchis sinensis TaxID=79923 RepID=A0A419QAN2_CLOSI|nr:hypothetical protein CSKR_107955 [Clonorchis sinensis]
MYAQATECAAPGRLMFQLLRYSRYRTFSCLDTSQTRDTAGFQVAFFRFLFKSDKLDHKLIVLLLVRLFGDKTVHLYTMRDNNQGGRTAVAFMKIKKGIFHTCLRIPVLQQSVEQAVASHTHSKQKQMEKCKTNKQTRTNFLLMNLFHYF